MGGESEAHRWEVAGGVAVKVQRRHPLRWAQRTSKHEIGVLLDILCS